MSAMPDPLLLGVSRREAWPFERVRRPVDLGIVCVPARNEEKLIGGLVDALAQGAHRAPIALAVALDSCIDDTAAVLASAASRAPFPVVTTSLPSTPIPSAGRARAASMRLGLRIARAMGARWPALLTTDADTRPEPGWAAQCMSGLADADLVAGLIRRDGAGGSIDAYASWEAYADALHGLRTIIDPDGPWAARSHPQRFGASLAIRADAYEAVGGLPETASNEDVGLFERMRAAGFRAVQDAGPRVTTSSRRTGRATGGLAEAMAAEDARIAQGEEKRVADPFAALRMFGCCARLRQAWHCRDREATRTFAAALGGDPGDAAVLVASAPSADALVARFEIDTARLPQCPLSLAWQRLHIARRSFANA